METGPARSFPGMRRDKNQNRYFNRPCKPNASGRGAMMTLTNISISLLEFFLPMPRRLAPSCIGGRGKNKKLARACGNFFSWRMKPPGQIRYESFVLCHSPRRLPNLVFLQGQLARFLKFYGRHFVFGIARLIG